MNAIVEILVFGAVLQIVTRVGQRYGYRVTTPIMLAVWVMSAGAFVAAWRAAAYSAAEPDPGWAASFILGAPAVAFFTTLIWHDGRRKARIPQPTDVAATRRLSVVARCGLLLLACVFGAVVWLETLTEPRASLALLGSLCAGLVCLWSAAVGAVPRSVAAFLRRDVGRNL